ncbi:DNA polymerase [Turicimonas muris]|uniref:DNA polymerase n=1 Tax=Turicimonas muris TaxID=1796652 RepID=UPI0023F54CE2|nr:DNA polymerase [Turicimonas muris]
MKTLWCDLETFSRIPITNGAHRYAEEVWVLLFGYAIDDEPAKVWDLTRQPQMPEDLKAALNEPTVNTVWHNGANFDSTVLRHAKNLRVDLPYERVDDCMVKAYSHGLPGSLGALCEVFNLPVDQAKDKDGHRLVLKFCKPDLKGEVHSYKTDPEDWERFVNYCRLDVESMRTIYKKLPAWNWQAKDRAQFSLDQRVNNRGVLMDVELAKAAIELAEAQRKKNAQLTQDLTGGEVEAATQRDVLFKYILKRYGVSLPDLTRSTIERRLADENIPEEVKELLRVRLVSTKTSTAKYQKLIDCVNPDDRLRGCLQFRGAQRTGRFSGRLMQLQNLPRPTLNQWLIDMGYDAIKQGWADFLAEPGELMASCLRGCIVAPEGKQLVVADLSNIEGRMLAWLAGEQWKIKAFRDFDAGHGPDLYKATYGRTFGVSPNEVTKKQRQIGKVMELALGYQGGVGAFLTFAAAYSIDLDELGRHVRESIHPTYWNQAEGSYEWYKEKKLTHGLKRTTFVACEAVKLAWRAAHPAIQKFWKDIDTAAISAIHGVPAGAGRLWFDKKGPWLRMRLPSGRYVCYPGVSLEDGGVGAGTFSYMGMNQYSRKWERIRTYSGKCAENATQATAADILIEAMAPIEAAGFRIVLSVHDEFITEAPLDKTHQELEKLMATPPAWARGLPLAAAGYTATRYRKD